MKTYGINILLVFLAIKLLENDGDLEKIVQEFPNGKDIIEVRNREARYQRQ